MWSGNGEARPSRVPRVGRLNGALTMWSGNARSGFGLLHRPLSQTGLLHASDNITFLDNPCNRPGPGCPRGDDLFELLRHRAVRRQRTVFRLVGSYRLPQLALLQGSPGSYSMRWIRRMVLRWCWRPCEPLETVRAWPCSGRGCFGSRSSCSDVHIRREDLSVLPVAKAWSSRAKRSSGSPSPRFA